SVRALAVASGGRTRVCRPCTLAGGVRPAGVHAAGGGTAADGRMGPQRGSAPHASLRRNRDHTWSAGVLAAVVTRAPDGLHRRAEEHTSELQSRENLVCRLLLEKKNDTYGLEGVTS